MGRTTYFLSDIHLGASYVADRRGYEERVVTLLQQLEPTAGTIYFLGDVLDYWFEYRTVVPRGYVRFFGQLARMADAGIRLVWFTGNHDIWLFDYLRDEIGIEIVDTRGDGIFTTIDGVSFFIGHGDLFGCVPRSYRMLRAIFRNRFCQRLYAAIHPRWTVPLAHAWSSGNRSGRPEADKERITSMLVARAQTLAGEHPDLKYIIIGHYHLALDEAVSPSCRLVALGHWLDGHTPYAAFTPPAGLSLHR